MSTITSNPSFSVGKSTLDNVQVRPLQDNKTLKDAETILKNSKDGNDTIGFTLDGQNYLASGILADPEGKTVTYNGKTVEVKFFENENNTALEGVGGALKSTAGIVSTVLVGAGVGGFAAVGESFGSGLLNLGSALVGGGTIAKANPGMAFLKGGAIAAGATLGLVGTIGAISGALKSGDDAVLQTLVKNK